MDYFHWIGGTVLLLHGIRLMGLRIYVLTMMLWVPPALLILETLSGWIATISVLATLAVAARVVRGPLRRREAARAERRLSP